MQVEDKLNFTLRRNLCGLLCSDTIKAAKLSSTLNSKKTLHYHAVSTSRAWADTFKLEFEASRQKRGSVPIKNVRNVWNAYISNMQQSPS